MGDTSSERNERIQESDTIIMLSSAAATAAATSWSNNNHTKGNDEEKERLLQYPIQTTSTGVDHHHTPGPGRYPYPRRSCLLRSSTEESNSTSGTTTGSITMLNMEGGGIAADGAPAAAAACHGSTSSATSSNDDNNNKYESTNNSTSTPSRQTDHNHNRARQSVKWSLRDNDDQTNNTSRSKQQPRRQQHYHHHHHHHHNPSALLPSLLKLRPLDGLQRHSSCPNVVSNESNNKHRRSVRWTHPKTPSELLLVGKTEKDTSRSTGRKRDDLVDSSTVQISSEGIKTDADEVDVEKAPLLHNEIINDEEEAEGEDILLHTLDRWEDEIDTHTTDMLPLSIQLALEQNLFGWQNLSADILSHILFTGGAAFLAYYFTSWLLLNNAHHPILQWLQWYTRIDSSSSTSSSSAASRTTSRWSSNSGNSNTTVPAEQQPVPILNMSHQAFEMVRTLATIVAAIVAFRVVRRRRRVWFHSAYGTKAYERDALRRRVSVKEVDQTTLLGKLRQHSRTKKLAKKVRKAQKRFERKQQQQVLYLKQQQQHEKDMAGSEITIRASSATAKVRSSPLPLANHSTSDEERNIRVSSSSTMVQNRRRRTKRCKNGISDKCFEPLLGDDITNSHNIHTNYGGEGASSTAIRKVKKSAPPLSPLHTKDLPSSHHRTSNTRHKTPSKLKPKTVLQDQIPVSEINVLPYAHGGFFGAAPFMLGDPKWVNLLRELMPDVYVEVAKRIFAPTPKLIHWAENNPVVAAYGTLHEKNAHGRVVTLEWDVFLDPYLVDRVIEAMEALDSFHAEHYVGEEEENDDDGETIVVVNNDIKRQRQVLEKNLQSAAMVLVEKMLIAHGSSLQLMMEQLGIFKRFNFSRIKRQRRTLGGGMYARQWLAVYAQAVKMATWQMYDANEEFLDKSGVTTSGSQDNDDSATNALAPEMIPVLKDTTTKDRRRSATDVLSSPRISPTAFGFTSSDDDDDDFFDDDSVTSTTSSIGFDVNEFFDHPLLSPTKEEVVDRAAKLSGLNKRRSSSSSSSSNCGSVGSETSPKRRTKRQGHRKSSSIGTADGTTSDGSITASPRKTTTTTGSGPSQRRSHPLSPSLSFNRRFGYYVPSTNMVESIDIIQRVLGEPIKLVLDLKSRHVPKEVWALVVDTLRDCGACVEGVASFTIQEIRGVSDCCVSPCKEIVFFHSAGDVQRACHEGLVKEGDSVFFNAGSLLWDFPLVQTLEDVWEFSKSYTVDFDVQRIRNYVFRSYARITDEISHTKSNKNAGTVMVPETKQDSVFITTEDIQDHDERMIAAATIADYKYYYKLNIGLYCQEFSVDDAAIDLLIRFVNTHSEVFNLGLSWGGVNGYTVKGIQPSRFTNTDGLWNQRYVGESWDYSLRPGDDYYSVNTTSSSSNDTASSSTTVSVGNNGSTTTTSEMTRAVE